MKTDKLRSRWIRWLGQKAKNEGWTNLLNTNYYGWLTKIYENNSPQQLLKLKWTKCTIKDAYKIAIMVATVDELQELDIIQLDEKLGI